MIIASASSRVSLGSADHLVFSERFGGASINFCINKRVYIIIRKRNDLEETKYRVSYSKTELCDDVDSINLCLVKEAIKMVGITDPLEIIYSSDLPRELGLGTSTAMATALLKGLLCYRNGAISDELLFDWAYRLERQTCSEEGGYQDLSVIWGGINYLEGRPYNIKRTPIVLSERQVEEFRQHMLLIYTGHTGNSSQALQDQLALLKCGETLDETLRIKQIVQEIKALMSQPDFAPLHLIGPMQEAWELKKKLSPTMTNDVVNFIEESVRKVDSNSAVRLVGGGAGRGLMLALAKPESLEKVRGAVHPLKTLDIEFDWTGVSARRVFDEY